MQPERYPLPFGWTKEFDQTSGQPFYVDTKANPPRSIWTHPYEDREYLRAHPDIREEFNANGSGDSDLPPSFEESQRRHSNGDPWRHSNGGSRRHSNGGPRRRSSGGPSSPSQPQPISAPATGSKKRKGRGLFGKLKDKAVGTKEEREAEWRRRQEEDRLRQEAQRQRVQQMIMARQQLYANQPQHGHGPAIMGSGYGSHRRRQGGGMGMGLPLLGGLAGGMLLSEAFDNDCGDFGGGDFGGF